MTTNPKRTIERIALLQQYDNRPEKLHDILEEVAAKGYHGADTWVSDLENITPVETFCIRAESLGLSVGVATGYMIGQYVHISKHPEQRFIEAVPGLDIDGFGTDAWGCPYNPDFKARYFKQLQKLAALPAVARILVNDEACMSNGCYCDLCVAAYEKEFGSEIPRLVEPTEENWRDERWLTFLKWRIDRWNAVHGEMADVIHQVNPDIIVGFQTSPGVDLARNPWSSAVDLHGMAKNLDAISVDPYYTSHKPAGFMPLETYLSEWCRFVKGMVPKGKLTEIVVQGFSHPNFTRPLNEADGLWSALVPPACGADLIMPYSYTLQKCSPVQEPYEKCFEFDRYFEQAEPIKHAAIVHGIQSEIYAHPLPRDVMDSYDGTRLFPVAESLRHHGVPYGYFPDACLDDQDTMSGYQVIVLPQIDCLSQQQAEGLKAYVANGGNIVILGALGSANEIGVPQDAAFLTELTGIAVAGPADHDQAIAFRDNLPLAEKIPSVDDCSAGYMEGAMRPVCRLNHCVDIEVPADADILARFADDDSNPSDRPAVISVDRGGKIVFFAGFPSRATINPKFGSEVQNTAYHWFAALVDQTAKTKAPLRVENWPPSVPINELRPTDRRHMNTFEFFPLQGDDLFLALVTSYFREPTTFPMLLDIPQGKRLTQVKELLTDAPVPFTQQNQNVTIKVKMDFNTPAKLFLFEIND